MVKISSILFFLLVGLLYDSYAVSAAPVAISPRPALISNGGTLHSFSDAVNLPLNSDADYGLFVDPQITGVNRSNAIYLMRLMPPGMRGDFTYVDEFGHVLSNRVSIANGVRFSAKTRATSSTLGVAKIGGRRVAAVANPGFPRPQSYPPTGGQGGAYIRNYSYQGINAAYGYATPPCDVNLPTDPYKDSGNMYFNAYDSNGSDVVDAGIGANNVGTSNIPGFDAQQVLTAFITPVQGSPWHNQSRQWPCDSPIGLMYGTLPSPNQNTSMLAVGIPDYDPTQLALPPASTTWTTSAWNFFPTNGALRVGPGTWNGIPSNCELCSVARMTTIGQPVSVLDNSCYGYCGSSPDARWDEVVMGELIAPCVNSGSTATCTIEFESNGLWLAGENDTNLGVTFDDPNPQQGLEGINLSTSAGSASRSRAPNSKFRALPLPTAPTTVCGYDSKNYCYVQIASTNQQCPGIGFGHATNTYTVDVFKKAASTVTRELQETAVETIVYAYDHNTCSSTPTVTWSPNNPALQYGDSSLP